MSVIVVTGKFGSGKTAYVVDQLMNDPQFEGRPLFSMGIPELKLEHLPVPPVSEWVEHRVSPEDDSLTMPYFTFPANSVIVIDEAQRIFRPRPVGSAVPAEVQAFETHRHTGVDFILITQHSGLLDSNIRKHKPRHVHIRTTPLGRYKYEWEELADPDKASDRELATKERYTPPKRVFDMYKSSEHHTKIKTKIPFYVWLFLAATVSAIGLGYYAYTRITAKMEPVTSAVVPGQKQASSSEPDKKMTRFEYLASFVPRDAGLYHTAPRYDDITQPVDAPWPALCVITHGDKEKCRCIDQQGNRYATPETVCRSIVENGIFKDWESPSDVARRDRERRSASVPSVDSSVPLRTLPVSPAPEPLPAPPAS